MKFNWGHGIGIGIACCVLSLGILVFLSSKENIDLVTEEYYPKELEYEQEIQKLKNTNLLSSRISLTISDSLYIQFPKDFTNKKNIDGEIWFYRPSDKDRDFSVKITLNDSLYMSFPLSRFENGKYEIIIDWNYQEKSYLTKEMLVF